MAKFNVTTVPGVENIQRTGTVAPVPVQPDTTVEDQNAAPASSPFLDSLADQGLIDSAAIPVGASPTLEEQQQRERERVEPLFDRADIREVPFNSDIDDAVVEANPYLGAVQRADRVAGVFDVASKGPTISALLTGTDPETGVKRIDALNEGNTEAAFRDLEITASRVLNDPAILDATVQDPNTGFRTVDPNFSRLVGLATEAFLVDHGSVEGLDFAETLEGEDVVEGPVAQQDAVKKAKGNARLGQAIWQEWQREKNLQQGLPSDQAPTTPAPSGQVNEYIGAMAKEAYALANPEVVARVPAGNQVEFQLKNPETLRAAQQGNISPFSGQEIAPLNAPSPSAQPQFEAKTYTRKEVTKVKPQQAGKMKRMEEARANYHQMAKVIDPRRLALFLQFGLPALRAMSAGAGQRQASPWADMLGIGKEKYESIAGEQQRLFALSEAYMDQSRQEADPKKADRLARKAVIYKDKATKYDVESVYQSELTKFLEDLNTATRYRNQAEYLTYGIQMLTGRMHVQQTLFNPGSRKNIRFVMGHGDRTAVSPGSNTIADRNFKELATIHLGLGGKNLQPEARVKQFNEALSKGDLSRYADMGKDLKQNLPTAEAIAPIADAIAGMDTSQGIQIPAAVQPLTNPPALKPETIQFLAEHGTEAPYIAEFLMDFADYHDGKPFHSAIEVEMDGITHGISTNGVALGIEQMAERAGVIQVSDREKLVTSEGAQGDIRQGMKDYMLEHGYATAENQGKGEMSNIFDAILQEAVKDRENYLKKSPMTLSYGQEIDNLRQHVENTVYIGSAAKAIRDLARQNGIKEAEVVDYLFGMLTDSLNVALDERIIQMSRLLRANNMVATMTNDVMQIESPAGFDQYIGAVGDTGETSTSPLSFTDEEGKRQNIGVTHYGKEASGSTLRPRVDEVSGDVSFTPGGFGHGRVIPAVIQGYDGNMIARTGSGDSFRRIQQEAKMRGHSGGFQPIFDAFKVPLGMMDVVRRESNKNWIDGLKEKNYFHSIDDWSRQAFRKFDKKMDELSTDQAIIDLEGEYKGIGYYLDYKKLGSQLDTVMDPDEHYDRNPKYNKQGDKITLGFFIAGQIMNEVRGTLGLDFRDPVPSHVTPQQAKQLVRIIVRHVGLNERNGKMRSSIDRDTKKLHARIDPKRILQVDLG